MLKSRNKKRQKAEGRRQKTGEKGFSLIELLAALAIFSIMALVLYIAFERTNQVWRHGEYKAQQYQNARTALDMISREMTAAIISTGGPTSFSNTNKPPYFWTVDGTGGTDYDQDQIYFVFPRLNAIYETGYYINDQTAGSGNTTAADDVLVRAYTSDSNSNFDISSTTSSFGSLDNVAFKVTDLNFNFIYKSGSSYQTTTSWDTRMGFTGQSTTASTIDDGKLPAFVEVSIRVVDSDILERFGATPSKTNRKEFRVMIPMGQRSFRNE